MNERQGSSALQENSDHYRKYFIAIRFESITYYIVWGADSMDNDDDKILIDENDNVLLFRTMDAALNYIQGSTSRLFDEIKMKKWTEFCQIHGAYVDCLFDLDFIGSLVENDAFSRLDGLKRAIGFEWINFVNLVGDYTYQTNNQRLLELRKGASMKIVWEYVYDSFFWKIPQEELVSSQKIMEESFDYSEFKRDATDLLLYVKSRFTVLPA